MREIFLDAGYGMQDARCRMNGWLGDWVAVELVGSRLTILSIFAYGFS